MAAYAALVSLMNIIDNVERHRFPPISLHKHQILSLTQNVIFLQELLQGYKSPVSDLDEADPLEMRIADAAYAAEDVIESHIVDKIRLSRATKIRSFFNCFQGPKDKDDPIKLYQGVQNVIEEMDRIKRVAMETNTEKVVVLRDERHRFVSSSTGTKSSDVMVFSDDVLHGIMEKLVADESGRQVIPITGMGGIGKTALAQTVYSKQLIKERFDICAWTTISEQYNMREILRELICQATNKDKEQLSERSEEELGIELHKYLFGRRFLIVLDDVWDIESWDEIQRFFPNNDNRSRIMVTTRLSKLGSQLNNHYSHQMKFLDEASSWVLFSKTVFGEEHFPLELEEIGREIADNCRGLPLSIVVVGGILRKTEHAVECWKLIRNNLTSVVNSDNDKHCFRLLKMSYNHLPVYLKPCFLYMGVFEEYDAISVSTLIKLWVCEGFLKPIDDKSLETVGKGFLKDLVDRNLVLVHALGSPGNTKVVKVHDLVRDLCVNQGKREGFYHVIGEASPRGINGQRRVVIRRNTSKMKVFAELQSMPHARSVICEHGNVPLRNNFGLLRSILAYKLRLFQYESSRAVSVAVSQNVNLRHLSIEVDRISSIFSTINHLWNLQKLIVSCLNNSTAPVEIWKMTRLSHIEVDSRLFFPNPPSDAVVMENLVVLKGAHNFKCDEEVVKRIPNIKKLRLTYAGSKGIPNIKKLMMNYSRSKGMIWDDYYCLSNIKYLCNLESLYISCWDDFIGNASLYKITFPQTLKSLDLTMLCDFEWETTLEKIGWLPHLEKFKLRCGCFGTGKWEIFEGQFSCLKFLGLSACHGLKHWTAGTSSIFPRLEKLGLTSLFGLENIPSEIGDIPTLQNIRLHHCCKSAVICAKEIVEEQVHLQGEDLPFHVLVMAESREYEAMQRFAGPNFEVRVSKF